MISYSIIILTTITSFFLIILSPPDKFFNPGKKWVKKFTWRAWIVIVLSLATMGFTILKQFEDDRDSDKKQLQIDRLEYNDSVLKSQLNKYGLKFDSNSNRILNKIDSSQKLKSTKIPERPYIDICKRGIQVSYYNDTTIAVDIPYCAITEANAYNVSLRSIVIYKGATNYRILNDKKEGFPKNVILTKETGKSIEYRLSPIHISKIDSLYFAVTGTYTNIDKSVKFTVKDIFKRSGITSDWVRLLGDEDKNIRQLLISKKLF